MIVGFGGWLFRGSDLDDYSDVGSSIFIGIFYFIVIFKLCMVNFLYILICVNVDGNVIFV